MIKQTTQSIITSFNAHLCVFLSLFVIFAEYILKRLMTLSKQGNPAVVGLAGFGLTTLLLQLHNIGLMGLGPVVSMGFIFGGLAQMIAGFQEQKVGNNFGYSAFVAYGAFWIGLGVIWLLNHFDIYKSSTTDVGYYLIAWTLYTVILFIASLWVHKAMSFTFGTLLLGFILLDVGHFGYPLFNIIAGYELIICALAAWYMMAGIIINDLAGKTVLPMGKPLISNPIHPGLDSSSKIEE